MELKYIDIQEVPKRYTRRGKWDAVFESIPKGKALILSTKNGINAAAALRRRHKKELYTNLVCFRNNDIYYVIREYEGA